MVPHFLLLYLTRGLCRNYDPKRILSDYVSSTLAGPSLSLSWIFLPFLYCFFCTCHLAGSMMQSGSFQIMSNSCEWISVFIHLLLNTLNIDVCLHPEPPEHTPQTASPACKTRKSKKKCTAPIVKSVAGLWPLCTFANCHKTRITLLQHYLSALIND